MAKRESLYHKFPDYRVLLEPCTVPIRVSLVGQVLADSTRALVVRETKHAPVVYIPREDVRLDLFERSNHQTFCPFKGEASYWTLRQGDRVEENLVWGYEDPFDEVEGLVGHLAFYPDRVEWDGGSPV